MRIMTRFMLAATDAAHFPAPVLPEVAFLGRSNVGKSSVINALVGKKLAKTGSTPGRTRSINFYELRWAGKPRPELIFTDLPGYGYAQVSRELANGWANFTEPYLLERPCLALCLALMDLNVPLQESDKQMVEFLESRQRPFAIVGTKADKLSGNELKRSLDRFAEQYPQATIVPFSAKSGTGQEQLWQQIRNAMQKNLPVAG
ncbi:MAG TPA: ribosome biogenesis GTP-binding protein YihA/YsxC [Terriglobales bacterium]